MKIIGACILSIVVTGYHSLAQQAMPPMGGGFVTGFVPAVKTIFSDDFFGGKVGSFPKEKWRGSGGILANIDEFQAIRTQGFIIWGGMDKAITPIIPEDSVTGRYVTFETDFQLIDTEATFFITFPGAGGEDHIFAINKKMLRVYGDGGKTPGLHYTTEMNALYNSQRFRSAQWHCLAMSFSETQLDIFFDNRHVWGFGNDSRNLLKGAHYELFFGYTPSTFALSGKGAVALKYVRFARSNEVLKGNKVQIAQFNKIATGEKFVTQDIHFEVNKADIKGESLPYLDALAGWLKQNVTIKLEIAGHTDSDGDEAANMLLSQQRATAIVNKLISSGIAANRLKGVGYGESKPVKPNDTEAGKAANRRVEFQKL